MPSKPAGRKSDALEPLRSVAAMAKAMRDHAAAVAKQAHELDEEAKALHRKARRVRSRITGTGVANSKRFREKEPRQERGKRCPE